MSNNGSPWPPITGGRHRGHFLRKGINMTVRQNTRPVNDQNVDTRRDDQTCDLEPRTAPVREQARSEFLMMFRHRFKRNEAGYRFLAGR
jgi:hypothetical protein